MVSVKTLTYNKRLRALMYALKNNWLTPDLTPLKAAGASYADVRIGRYLNQFVITRENRVQNVANTESYGVGIRVIANGCWGFAATNDVTKEGIAKTAKRAVAVAKLMLNLAVRRCSLPRKKVMAK
jgi:TldD protein